MSTRIVLVLLGGVALLVACTSSGEEAAPTRAARPAPTSTSDGGSSGTTDAPDASIDPSCIGPDQCFACEPQKLDDWLDECTDEQCVPFDNVARLPLYQAGKPLPPVP